MGNIKPSAVPQAELWRASTFAELWWTGAIFNSDLRLEQALNPKPQTPDPRPNIRPGFLSQVRPFLALIR